MKARKHNNYNIIHSGEVSCYSKIIFIPDKIEDDESDDGEESGKSNLIFYHTQKVSLMGNYCKYCWSQSYVLFYDLNAFLF